MADERDRDSAEYLDDEPTHVIARPSAPTREPGDGAGLAYAPLYDRLVDALQLGASAVDLLVSDLLVQVGATPARLTPAQLWDMRNELFELVDGVLPAAVREGARTNVLTLMLSVAPLLPATSG
jgi:hypothetical protein